MVSSTALSSSCLSSRSGLAAARVRASKLKRNGCSTISAAGSRLEIWLMPAMPISTAPDCTAPTTWSSMNSFCLS
jgi:hypothetical protein